MSCSNQSSFAPVSTWLCEYGDDNQWLTMNFNVSDYLSTTKSDLVLPKWKDCYLYYTSSPYHANPCKFHANLHINMILCQIKCQSEIVDKRNLLETLYLFYQIDGRSIWWPYSSSFQPFISLTLSLDMSSRFIVDINLLKIRSNSIPNIKQHHLPNGVLQPLSIVNLESLELLIISWFFVFILCVRLCTID